MKEKTSQRLNKAMLIANLREIADQLERESFKIGEKTIVIPESSVLTREWKEKISKRKLEIEIEWKVILAARKCESIYKINSSPSLTL